MANGKGKASFRSCGRAFEEASIALANKLQSLLEPKHEPPKEQSKSEAAAVLFTGIAESSTASRALVRLEQEAR